MIPSHIAGYPIILPEHRHQFHLERPEWHKAWLDSIHESLKPDDVVIDVGAEQGDLSALVASWVPDGGVVLVEPQPLFWPTIRATFEANGLKPMHTFVGFADDASTGWMLAEPMSRWPKEADAFGAIDPGFYHINEHVMAKIAIDDMPVVPSALIIDVEGAEFYVLRGAEELLTTLPPLVWCAIHPEIMRDRYGHDPNELMAYMYRLGYRWDFLGFQGELHFKFSPR